MARLSFFKSVLTSVKREQNIEDSANSYVFKGVLPLSGDSNTSAFPAGPFVSEAGNLPDMLANNPTVDSDHLLKCSCSLL